MARLQGRFLAGGAVTTDKIVDHNVTLPKLDDTMVDQASGLAVLDASRKISIERIPQALIDDVADHEARLNALEGRQTLRELVTLTQAEIDAKAFDLTNAPTTPALTILQPVNGVVAALGIDYSITGATVAWSGLGLDTVGLAVGDQIQVWYDYASGGVAGDLAQEILDRQSGDAALQAQLDQEILDRQSGDADAAGGIQAAINSQIAGDNTLLAEINGIKAQKAAANGLASLDANGKVPASQLPSSVMTYKGVWDASSNTPTLADGGDPEQIGNVYRVSVAGTRNLGSGAISFDVGDYAIMNALQQWEKSDTTDAVSSVNGKAGSVTVDLPDFPLVQAGLAAAIPAGVVMPYAGAITPAGFLLCDGSEVSQALYPNLYAAIGNSYDTQYNEVAATFWGAPSVGNFRVPDYRGSFLRGVGTPSGLDTVTLGGRQAQKTAKNGLANASSTVTGTTNIGHTHAASTVYINKNQWNSNQTAHSHGVYGQATSAPWTGAYQTNSLVGSSSTANTTTTSASVSWGSVNATGSADGQTLATTNVALASGSAAAQTITGDNETRPVNKGVNFIIRAS